MVIYRCGKIIQQTLLAFTAFFVTQYLFVGAVRAQTLDSLNLTISETVPEQRPVKIFTAIPLPDGRILAAGDAVKFTGGSGQWHTNIVRINTDGSVDDTYHVNIYLSAASGLFIGCLALQTDGQILVGGAFQSINSQYRFNVARLNADGVLDTNFDAGGVNDGVNSLLVQPDGKILLCGNVGLWRLNYDGSQDTNFNAGANNVVSAIALQPDGKIVAKGYFTSIGGQSRTNLARLNPDGSLDTSFQPAVFTLQGFYSGPILIQPDGKILVGGLFTQVNGQHHVNLVRFNPDGTVDPTFIAQTDQYNSWGLQTLALQADGKILIGDDSHIVDGQPYPYFCRLNPDGSLDTGFSHNLVSGTMVFSCPIQPDGKILVAGWYDTLGGLNNKGLGRLINTNRATQSLTYDGTNILWLHSGTSPEFWRTSFESSTDSTNWTCLGDGLHISGGWQLTNVTVSINAFIRARGFVTGGRFNGSSWFVESMYPQTAPIIASNDGRPGFRANKFGFNFSGSAGSSVVIDASSALLNWTPMATNMLPSGPLYFNDPSSTNAIQKFYRVRLQQ